MIKRMAFGVAAALLLSVLSGCTDTFMADISAFGNRHAIKCWSGTLQIYEGYSTGKVESPEGSDGYRFMAEDTGLLTEVSGNCIIETLPN